MSEYAISTDDLRIILDDYIDNKYIQSYDDDFIKIARDLQRKRFYVKQMMEKYRIEIRKPIEKVYDCDLEEWQHSCEFINGIKKESGRKSFYSKKLLQAFNQKKLDDLKRMETLDLEYSNLSTMHSMEMDLYKSYINALIS